MDVQPGHPVEVRHGFFLICAIDHFRTQVEIACRAGASGYLAGRSIWRDAVSTHDPAEREKAIEQARGRLEELNAVTRANGRPYSPARPLDEVLTELPPEWYRTWHADA